MDPNQSLELEQGKENMNQMEDDNNKYNLDEPKEYLLKEK